MSGLGLKWILGTVTLVPLVFTPVFLLQWRIARIRKLVASTYALIVFSGNAAMLYFFMDNNARAFRLWWMRAASFSLSLVVLTGFLSAAVVLWLGLKRTGDEVPKLVPSCITFTTCLAAMMFLTIDIVPYAAFWIGISLLAFTGYIASRSGNIKKAFMQFAPWFIADLIFLVGAVLCSIWLKEGKVLIEAPLKSGSETQVMVIMIMFLVSCFLRLGIFPFNIFISNLFAGSDSNWSAFFLGTVNLLIAGSRLIITSCLIARFIASDWSSAIIAVGLVSMVAGPIQALRARSTYSFVTGMYLFQVSFMVVGAGLFSRPAWEGAMYCLFTAPVLLTGTIVAMDRISEIRGTNELGIRTISPGNAVAAFITLLFSGMAMAGFPPSDGFMGKATVVLAGMDKSAIHGYNSLIYVFASVGCAVTVIAVIRTVSKIFEAGKGDTGRTVNRPTYFEGFIPIALCVFSYFIGVFPWVILNELIAKSSRTLMPAGFSGPGIVFHGIGSQAKAVFDYFKTWAMDPVAFLAGVSMMVVTLYFINRAASPSNGPAARFLPFEGGAGANHLFGRSVRNTRYKQVSEKRTVRDEGIPPTGAF